MCNTITRLSGGCRRGKGKHLRTKSHRKCIQVLQQNKCYTTIQKPHWGPAHQRCLFASFVGGRWEVSGVAGLWRVDCFAKWGYVACKTVTFFNKQNGNNRHQLCVCSAMGWRPILGWSRDRLRILTRTSAENGWMERPEASSLESARISYHCKAFACAVYLNLILSSVWVQIHSNTTTIANRNKNTETISATLQLIISVMTHDYR